MTRETREEKWVSFLKKKGYRAEFKRYEYWINVLYAVKNENSEEEEIIPIAHSFINSNYELSVVTQRDIVVSERNLEILKNYELGNNFIKLRWVKNGVTLEPTI
ncbi:MAG: hypothetical protein ACP5U0_09245 [Caldisphaera sp.]